MTKETESLSRTHGRSGASSNNEEGNHDTNFPPNFFNGEALRGEGSLSAPPPPGFITNSHEERVGVANQGIWTDSGVPAHWFPDMRTRTTSFSNLAAMVGTGLAESMEDSTQDSRRDSTLYDLSYARQFRHTASRVLGSSSSGLSPTAALLDLTLPVHPHKRGSDASSFLNLGASSPTSRKEPPSTLPLFSRPEGTDPMEDFRSNILYRNQQLPSGMFDSDRPTEVGVTVMEPDVGRQSAPPQLYADHCSSHGTPVISRQGTPDLCDLNRGFHSLNLENQSIQSSEDISIHSATEAELEPYLWDVNLAEPSRAIAILRMLKVPVLEIRSTCEAFGAIEIFRADFAHRGIIFVGYYDIRSAQRAVSDLTQSLHRLSSSVLDVEVKFCVPLNSSSPHDESIIVLSDLPRHLTERQLMSMLSSYGSIRSVHLQGGAHYGGDSYVVEFHNVQDAKLALLEMESSQPWGHNVMVEVGPRRAVDRRRGRELLSIIGSWRQNNRSSHQSPKSNLVSGSTSQGPTYQFSGNDFGSSSRSGHGLRRDGTTSEMNSMATLMYSAPTDAPSFRTMKRDEFDGNLSTMSQATPQLVLGPDGHFSYVVVNNSAYPQPRQVSRSSPHRLDLRSNSRILHPLEIQHQPVLQMSHGAYTSVQANQAQGAIGYWNHPPHHQDHFPHTGGRTSVRDFAYAADGAPYPQTSTGTPFYPHAGIPNNNDLNVSTGDHSIPSGIPHGDATIHRRHQSPPLNGVANGDEKDNRHLTLDIQAVLDGRDVRTSLMVRNIPNKYTQQMLIAELSENGHGPGKIDFFYLPIDFKNKCNRGYAFVNFVEYKDIVPFHRQYFGQHWRVFNSEKKCDITYARIQGKTSMLKRFENSALMEKDEEYKPLVFVSHGVDKGKRLPFPADTNSS